jgi:hypothetical protein
MDCQRFGESFLNKSNMLFRKHHKQLFFFVFFSLLKMPNAARKTSFPVLKRQLNWKTLTTRKRFKLQNWRAFRPSISYSKVHARHQELPTQLLIVTSRGNVISQTGVSNCWANSWPNSWLVETTNEPNSWANPWPNFWANRWTTLEPIHVAGKQQLNQKANVPILF